MRRTFAVAVCCILFGSVAQAPAQPPTQLSNSKPMTVAINGVQIEGLRSATELTGIEQESDAVEARQNPGKRILSGKQKYGTLVLTRAAPKDDSLYQWHKSVAEGRQDRRSVTITVYNQARQPVRSYHFRNCWPVRYSRPGAARTNSSVGRETIELTYESVQVQ